MINPRITALLDSVRDFYNSHATSFATTRNKFWRDGEYIAQLLPQQGRILDVGCGNGRLTTFLSLDVDYTGVDNAENIIKIAQKQYANDNRTFAVGSMMELPFADNSFDCVIACASLHHVPGYAAQLQSLQEMHRVLQADGFLVCTVWNLRHPHYRELYKFTEEDFEKNGGDMEVPYKADGAITHRFVHAFTEEELETLLVDAGFTTFSIQGIHEGVVGDTSSGSNFLVLAQY